MPDAITLGRAYDGEGPSPVGLYRVTWFVAVGGRAAVVAAA